MSVVTSRLNDLIETLKDGEKGFKKAAEEAKNPDLKQTLSTLSSQRATFASQLQAKVSARGEKAEKSGSVGGALRRGWMDIKKSVTNKDDLAILEVCEQGEDAAVKAFQDAISSGELSDDAAIVNQQFAEIRAAHDKVRALRNSLRGTAAASA